MEDIKKICEKLAKEDPESMVYPFRELMDYMGFEGIYALSEKFGGTTIYIPRPRKLFKDKLDELIRLEFDGGNYNKLAQKYELCEKSIRNIVNKR
jgi:Mor family transcriptional regulator